MDEIERLKKKREGKLAKKKEMVKKYYNDNREELLEKKREKFECACGGRYTRSSKSAHEITRKHIEYLEGKDRQT
jgi:redox-regulated HSP33 family molecular chaperone